MRQFLQFPQNNLSSCEAKNISKARGVGPVNSTDRTHPGHGEIKTPVRILARGPSPPLRPSDLDGEKPFTVAGYLNDYLKVDVLQTFGFAVYENGVVEFEQRLR